jgi:CHRD domain
MKKLTILGLIVSLGVLALAAVAFAGRSHDRGDAKNFSAKLNGWEEDPSQVTTGKGSFSADIVSATQINFTLKYEDLEGPAFMAHIHIGSRHESGGISAWLCGGTTQPACPPGPDATVTGTIEAADITGPATQGVEPGNFVDLIRAIRKGETYTNVHTGSAGPPPSGRAPGGEIRGQNHVNKRGHDDHKGKDKRH